MNWAGGMILSVRNEIHQQSPNIILKNIMNFSSDINDLYPPETARNALDNPNAQMFCIDYLTKPEFSILQTD